MADTPIEIVDLAGRIVRMPSRPKRIVLLEARDLVTLSLLHPDPPSLVVGWAAVDRIDSGLLQEKLANGRLIPVVGKQTPDTISIEGLVGLSPDLVVTNAFMSPQGEADPLIGQLMRFGIPVIFSDASSNKAAAENPLGPAGELKASLRMWGTLLGASPRAEAFISFSEGQMSGIERRLAGAKPVTTYFEVQSTSDDCCWAAGRKIWGELLEMAGGQPLPEITAPWFQKLSLEYLLSTPHDVYIATGGGWVSGDRPAIGPGLDPRTGKKDLERLVERRTGFDQLESVRNGRVYGIWSGLITNLPLNVVFVALAAKWLHPDRCGDLDPAAILEAINRDFAAFPIEGPLSASFQKAEH